MKLVALFLQQFVNELFCSFLLLQFSTIIDFTSVVVVVVVVVKGFVDFKCLSNNQQEKKNLTHLLVNLALIDLDYLAYEKLHLNLIHNIIITYILF